MPVLVKITRQENADHYGVNVGDTVTVSDHVYVSAVVASEVGDSHIEVCKAQAVAARTFAALKNWSVTDSSAKDQAFRAKRYDSTLYPNAVAAELVTDREILTHNGKPISAVYSACNGGRTVSAKTRWGSERSYLPEQDDPWDDSEKCVGHGVGMSQRGAKAMAAAGKTYREILEFYYPGTTLEQIKMAEKGGDANDKSDLGIPVVASPSVQKEGTMVTAEQFVQKVKYALENKWGYIYGTAGKLWTKELQNRMNKTTEEKYAKSRQYGSKWIGKMVTDCSGLVRQALLQFGVSVAHHALYLYTDYCQYKGKLMNGVPDDGHTIRPGTLVFIKSNKEKIHHVGVYVGGDICIEAKGVQYGVVTSSLSHWEYWGELKCVDYDNQSETPEVISYMRATVNNPGKWLNVRSNAGTQYPAVFTLNKGDVVDVLDCSDKEWWQIQYGGRIGWVSAKYLVTNDAAPAAEKTETSAKQASAFDKAELENLVQLIRASVNALYDEVDRLDEMVTKL